MAKQQSGKAEKKRIDLSFIDIELQNNDKVKALFTEAGIDAADRDGRTLLLNACCYNNIELAGWAIDNGTDINHQDNNGWSALHFAVQARSFAIAELLLQNKITVDLQDIYGDTALWRGVNTNVDSEIIQLLIREGANPGLKNFNQVAPADIKTLHDIYETGNHGIFQESADGGKFRVALPQRDVSGLIEEI